METHIVQQVNHPDDLLKLHDITSRILGQYCCRAWLGYGDELKLRFGQTCQEWYLGGRGSNWILYAEKDEITNSSDIVDNANAKLALLTNASIVSFETSYPDLSLAVIFENNMRLQIISEFDTEEEAPRLAYWELFTPDHMLLEVGPKSQWRFKSSKLPIVMDDPYYE
jgi:hypothetical protein